MFHPRHRLMSLVMVLVLLLLLALPLAASAAKPDNGITNPTAGSTVKGTIQVTGNATDPNFWKWQLDLLPKLDPNAAISLAIGFTSPLTYTLDTTAYPNGGHALRLRVVKTNANYTEYTTPFTITNVITTTSAGTTTKMPSTGTANTAPITTTTTTTAMPSTGTATTAPVTTTTTTTTTAPKMPSTGSPPAGTATTNGITSPANNSTVTGKVNVAGYANDPMFWKWQVDLLPNGDPNAAIWLAGGAQTGNFTFSWDSKPYPNGAHALRLRVVRTDGNYSEYTNAVTIANK